MEFERIPH